MAEVGNSFIDRHLDPASPAGTGKYLPSLPLLLIRVSRGQWITLQVAAYIAHRYTRT
jgi:hypothetical protein